MKCETHVSRVHSVIATFHPHPSSLWMFCTFYILYFWHSLTISEAYCCTWKIIFSVIFRFFSSFYNLIFLTFLHEMIFACKYNANTCTIRVPGSKFRKGERKTRITSGQDVTWKIYQEISSQINLYAIRTRSYLGFDSIFNLSSKSIVYMSDF